MTDIFLKQDLLRVLKKDEVQTQWSRATYHFGYADMVPIKVLNGHTSTGLVTGRWRAVNGKITDNRIACPIVAIASPPPLTPGKNNKKRLTRTKVEIKLVSYYMWHPTN